MTEYRNTSNFESVNSLLNDIGDSKLINLNPSYQRDIVWDGEKQSMFINSIFKGIVPFNIVFNLDTKTGKKVCIDGKQRLTSLQLFENNKIVVELDDIIYYYDKIPVNTSDKETKNLSNLQKIIFRSVKIPICTYENLSYASQIEIFSRLQNGVASNSAEKLVVLFNNDKECRSYNDLCNSLYEYVKKFVSHIERQDHKQLISEILYISSLNKLESITNDKIKEYIKKLYTQSEEIRESKFKKLTSFIKNIFTDELLNHDSIAYSINKNKFFVIIYKLNRIYDLKKIKSDECKIVRNVIIKLRKEQESKKIRGGAATEKVLIRISNLYDKYYTENNELGNYSESDEDE